MVTATALSVVMAGGISGVVIVNPSGTQIGYDAGHPLFVTGTSGGPSANVNVDQWGGVATVQYSAGDGVATQQPGIPANVVQEVFNGATYDRMYGTWTTTELSSASRSVATNGSNRTNFNSRSVQCALDVTAASGTGGLTLQIQGRDPISGNWYNLNNTPGPVTATGTYVYEISPSLGLGSGGVVQRTAGMVPRTIRMSVGVGDASAYTYSVGCNFAP